MTWPACAGRPGARPSCRCGCTGAAQPGLRPSGPRTCGAGCTRSCCGSQPPGGRHRLPGLGHADWCVAGAAPARRRAAGAGRAPPTAARRVTWVGLKPVSDLHRQIAALALAAAGGPLRTMVWPSRWSSSAARAHAVVVSVLTPAEILIAARRLAGARPRLAAVAGIVHHEDLWQLCRNEHRSRRPHRWLGHPRPLGRRSRRGHAPDRGAATIPWHVIAAQIAPRERRGSR